MRPFRKPFGQSASTRSTRAGSDRLAGVRAAVQVPDATAFRALQTESGPSGGRNIKKTIWYAINIGTVLRVSTIVIINTFVLKIYSYTILIKALRSINAYNKAALMTRQDLKVLRSRNFVHVKSRNLFLFFYGQLSAAAWTIFTNIFVYIVLDFNNK